MYNKFINAAKKALNNNKNFQTNSNLWTKLHKILSGLL